MLTQEEFMDVLAMCRQGLSIREIADATGYHPATISSRGCEIGFADGVEVYRSDLP